jgi:hypothetical protein
MDMNTEMELIQNERSTTEVYDEIKIIKDSLKKLLRKAIALRKAKVELEETGASPFEDVHLRYVIKYSLENNSPASKAFIACEQKFEKEAGWSKKVIEYNVNKNRFNRAIDTLLDAKNEQLLLLEKFDQLKNIKIKKDMRYRAILVELNKQYKSADFINTKNCEVKAKELIIEEMNDHITNLNQELEASLSMNLETRAKLLKKLNPKYIYEQIGEIIGVSRQRASNLINKKPKIKM